MSTHYFSFNFLRNCSVFACYWCGVCSGSAIFHPVMWNDTQSRPPLIYPITLATTAPSFSNDCADLLMFPEIQNCNEGKNNAFPVQNFWFYNILQNIFFQLLYVFSVSFTLSVKIGNFKRPNLFLVHVLRYVAASVLRVLNSYLMRRQRWRDRGEEGVSVTPSPRYSSGCQIIFSQTFNFPILATTRAIHWKLPDQSGQATVTISYRPGPRKWSGTETDVP